MFVLKNKVINYDLPFVLCCLHIEKGCGCKHWIIIQMLSVLTMGITMGKDIHVESTDVEAIAVIKKNSKT